VTTYSSKREQRRESVEKFVCQLISGLSELGINVLFVASTCLNSDPRALLLVSHPYALTSIELLLPDKVEPLIQAQLIALAIVQLTMLPSVYLWSPSSAPITLRRDGNEAIPLLVRNLSAIVPRELVEARSILQQMETGDVNHTICALPKQPYIYENVLAAIKSAVYWRTQTLPDDVELKTNLMHLLEYYVEKFFTCAHLS
jgi:hypothetical protein